MPADSHASKNLNEKILDIRREYQRGALDLGNLSPDPLLQFEKWFTEAQNAQVNDPLAMTLSTVDPELQPSNRIVLLRGVDIAGFRFFTNYESHKGKDLALNPKAALSFFWSELERQVLIQGQVRKLSEKESIAYFQSRPRGSQISAWASAQSSAIENRKSLDDRVSAIEAQFPNEVPRPAFWGGYLLTPHRIEFWQGRANRLHDRFQFDKNASGDWLIRRLAP